VSGFVRNVSFRNSVKTWVLGFENTAILNKLFVNYKYPK